MKIGLYFGSFNPVHVGHMIIANYIVEYSDIQQLWMVVSPQNPLKNHNDLLDDYQRYEMVYRAIGDSDTIKVSKIEFSMPKPSYTIDTLAYISDKYTEHTFSLIIGADNLKSFHKWKNYETILKLYSVYVFPRLGYDVGDWKNHPSIHLIDAPIICVSSSFIRKAIKERKNICHFMPLKAYEYLSEMHFYEK